MPAKPKRASPVPKAKDSNSLEVRDGKGRELRIPEPRTPLGAVVLLAIVGFLIFGALAAFAMYRNH